MCQGSVQNLNFRHRVYACCLNVVSSRHRYGQGLTWTVLVMAEGTCTGEMPSFDLRACSEAKKRPFSSDGSESLFVTCCSVCFLLLSTIIFNLKVITLKFYLVVS